MLTPWRIQVLVALAGFPDGATIARLTRPLADGNRGCDSTYRRIYRALRASESHGHVRRTYRARPRMPFAWGEPEAAGYGQPAITWQLTPAGASYLADQGQATDTPGLASGTPGTSQSR